MKIGVKVLAGLLLLAGLIGVGCKKKQRTRFRRRERWRVGRRVAKHEHLLRRTLWQYMDGGRTNISTPE